MFPIVFRPRVIHSEHTWVSFAERRSVRKLAKEFDDAQVARILNKQGRRTGFRNPYTKSNVLSMRGRHKIPKCPKKLVKDPKEGPFTADEASVELAAR